MEETIKKILNIAVNAPSGDNSQPWEFKITERGLDIYNIPDRDNPIFNFKQRGSYIAHGALIQNIILLSPLFGLTTEYKLFPNTSEPNITVSIKFNPSQENPLNNIENLIKSRTTNRRKYTPETLNEQQKSLIFQSSLSFNSIKFKLLEDRHTIKEVAGAVSSAECVMLQYKPLHDSFFEFIRWNTKEVKSSNYGMSIDTLELKPQEKLIFKWFSNWKYSSILRYLKLPYLIAKENSKIYNTASAIGVISVDKFTPENFILTGMLLQNIWLKITELGLSMQPIAGILYLDSRLKENGIKDMPEKLQALISKSAETIVKNTKSEHITMMFRIGKSKPPSALSIKNTHFKIKN